MNFNLVKEIKLTDEIFDARYHSKKNDLIGVATIAGDIHL